MRGRSDSLLSISPPLWRRGRRVTLDLLRSVGVYALFLAPDSSLAQALPLNESGLVYVGKAGGSAGLYGRCHFRGKTVTHSPRRSLAALLRHQIGLELKPGSALYKWGLVPTSEEKLDAWMHQNLEMAYSVCSDERGVETELLARYAPPLNLSGCEMNPWRQKLSGLRAGCCREAHAR